MAEFEETATEIRNYLIFEYDIPDERILLSGSQIVFGSGNKLNGIIEKSGDFA